MRNECQRLLLLAVLVTFTGVARAEPGSWFPASPCPAESARQSLLPGTSALLSVHDQPDTPPHDVVVEAGPDGIWRVPIEEWSTWTPLPPPRVDTAADGTQRVPIKPGRSLALRLDACTAELWVDANPDRRQVTDLNRPPPHPVSRAGYGGFVNFDANYGGLAGRDSVSSLIDLGAFTPGGAGRSSYFVSNDAVRRLDTSWTHDDTERAVRLRLGDSITRNADWESAVRFGGVQWGTDFTLQPDRITFPLPAIAGSAALASTAQLYVNGVRQSQQPVQPGQFRFESVPALTGAGELTVVVRDALGREQTVTQPFYASPRLLTAGLSANTYEAGFLREDFAGPDDRYTQPFAGATLQHGYSDTVTGLLRATTSSRRQLGGAEADWIASPLGVFTLSAAVSNTEAGWGGIGTLAFERQANDVSLFLRRRIATRAYGDLGREPGTLHFSDAGRVSYNSHRAGVFSALYVSEQPWDGSGVRLAGLAWNLQIFSDLSGYASWLHPLSGGGGDSIVAGLSIALGQGTSAGLQYTRDDNGQGPSASIQHAPPGTLGWAYSASADARDQGVRQAQASLATARGTVGAGYAGFGNSGAASATVQTGLAFLGNGIYWTRPVQNSFAVVDAGKVPGVRVYRENQLVGQTGADGRLLVPDLLPFSVNRLRIDDTDLPLDVGLVDSGVQIAPPANAGVPVHFSVDSQPSLRLRLVDEAGEPVPAGAALELNSRSLPLPVGYDGLVYADLTKGTYLLTATWPEGHCVAVVGVIGNVVKAGVCRRGAQ